MILGFFVIFFLTPEFVVDALAITYWFLRTWTNRYKDYVWCLNRAEVQMLGPVNGNGATTLLKLA